LFIQRQGRRWRRRISLRAHSALAAVTHSAANAGPFKLSVLRPAASRAFKAAVGRSPHHYVSAKRLELAKQLLGKGDQPLAHIALTLKFSCQANFTRAFREATGQTPAQYRRSVGMIAAEPAAKKDNS
jgi:methylphosphotriester-DNA--protein-cysteine methyltransferase